MSSVSWHREKAVTNEPSKNCSADVIERRVRHPVSRFAAFGQAADVGRDAFDYASERNSEEIKRRDAPLSTAVAPRGSNGCNDGGGDLLGGIGMLRRP